MSKKIKGITIEIGGDTKPLQQALKDVNTKTKDLNSELYKVDRLLKLDPGNTELLAQKQKLLSEAVENSTDKLKRLEKAEKDVQEQFKKGKISEEQYRHFQRTVINAEQELNKFKTKAEQTEKTSKELAKGIDRTSKEFKEFEKAAEEAGQKISSAMDTASKATAGVAAVVSGAAVKSFDDFDKAVNGLQASTGATDKEMEGLKKTLQNIYSNNFGEDFEDIGQAVAVIKQQTNLAGKELESTATNALMLRDTFDMDVNESIRSANMLVKQFGICFDEAYTLIAQGAQKGLNKNENLLDSINEYSVHFNQLGLDADDMFNMLANGAETGVFDIDKLGDAVKEFGIRVKEESNETTEAFESLGLDAGQMVQDFAEGGESGRLAFEKVTNALLNTDDQVLKNQAGVALFGTMWEDLGVEAINALTEVDGNIEQTKDTLEKINEVKYDSFSEGIQGVGRQLVTDLIMPMGEELIPFLEWLKEFIIWFTEDGEVLQAVILGIGTALLTWKVAGIITKLKDAVIKWTAANQGATIAQNLLNTAMNANPIGIIITLVTALAAAVLYLWNTNEDFRNAVIEIWTNIKETVVGAVTAVRDFATPIVEGFTGFMTDKFGFVWESIQKGFEAFEKLFSGDFEGFLNGIKDSALIWVKGWKDIGSDIVKGIWEGIKSMGRWIKGKVTGFFDDILGGAKDFLGIQSPSKLFSDVIGKNMALGIGEGFTKELSSVNKQAKLGLSKLTLEMEKTAGSTKNTTINQNLTFNGNYKARDGRYITNDINRQLGLIYR